MHKDEHTIRSCDEGLDEGTDCFNIVGEGALRRVNAAVGWKKTTMDFRASEYECLDEAFVISRHVPCAVDEENDRLRLNIALLQKLQTQNWM